MKLRIPFLVVGLAAGVWLLGDSRIASAQTTASISGTIADDTGGVLPAVEVTVTNSETGIARSALTDERGRYRVTSLNIGRYDVSATLPGFQTVVRRGIELTIGREAVVDITLALGELTDQVTVTGDAPLVDTSSGSMGGIVSRETIQEIPLNGRDLTGLITLQSGTAMSTTTQTGGSHGYSRKFSISGARVADNTILLDGTDVKSFDGGVPAGVSGNFLGGEAIQEFKVERNAYSAEFGGGSGGVINVVSKSGTNEFHGSVYGFYRNDALDAANFRAPVITDAAGNVVGKDKPDFWRGQYGASAGGRIIRNRTFYFLNFEGLRERLGVINFATTFSADGRRGILPGGNVPVSPAVAPYLDLWPLPAGAEDLGDGTARYSVSTQQPTDEDFYQARVDHNFSESDAIFGRVTKQSSLRTSHHSIPRWGLDEEVYNFFSTAEYRKILSNKLLNTFRFGFNRRGIRNFSFEDPQVDPALLLLTPAQWLAPLGAPPSLGGLSVSGLTQVGIDRGWVDRNTNRFQFMNSAVYTSGAHTVKFGVDWSHLRMGGDNPDRPGGFLVFGSIESFLRGRPRQFRGDWVPETDWNRNLRWNVIGSYVQSDWQVAPRLTVNLGLRHEFYTVPTERDGKISNLRNPLTDTEITILGTQGDSWWENGSFMNFGPRLGMAWDPTGSGRTSVRGGFGVFFNTIHAEAFRREAWRNAPFAISTNLNAPEGVIPFPTGLYDFVIDLGAAQGDLFPFPYEPGNPRMLQWNVNLQREILNNVGITVGYAGSRGLELPDQVSLNTAKAERIDGRYVFPVGATRPNRAFNVQLDSQQTVAESWYHSLQAEVQRRFQGGWQLQLSYTWSKSIDTASAFTGPTFTGNAQSGGYVHDRSLARGLSAFHIGQRFSASAVWQLPGAAMGGLAGALFGGWQLSGILNLADGPPFSASISSRSSLAAIGLSAEKPDLVPGGDNNPVIGDPDRYFDASQFAFPPARTIGDLGRNTLIGPGVATVDIGVTKNFQIGRAARTQFRLEVFNLLNRANFGLPANNVFNSAGRRSANAGFIDSTATTARQIQLGLRFDW